MKWEHLCDPRPPDGDFESRMSPGSGAFWNNSCLQSSIFALMTELLFVFGLIDIFDQLQQSFVVSIVPICY